MQAHPAHEKYLNKKIEMYDEMQPIVGKDLATRSFVKSFFDVDSTSTKMNCNPVDNTTKKETSECSVPLSQKRSHRKRKQRTSDTDVEDDDGIKELAMEVRQITKAKKDMNK